MGCEDTWLGDNRYGDTRQDLENPLAAVQKLDYVNPEGKRTDLLSAQDIREIFGRMAMNDEELLHLSQVVIHLVKPMVMAGKSCW